MSKPSKMTNHAGFASINSTTWIFPKKYEIAIIGASIAGATFALQILQNPLLSAKYHPVLFDAANHIPGLSPDATHEGQNSGAAFGLTIQALFPLSNLLGDELKKIVQDHAQVKMWRQPLFGRADISKPWKYVNRIISPGRVNEDIGGLMGVERADLQGLLVRKILENGGEVHVGKRVAEIIQDDSSECGNYPIEITFADKTSARCSLLVGADGAWSAVRKHLFTESSLMNGQIDEKVDEGWMPNFSRGTMLYGISNLGTTNGALSPTEEDSIEYQTAHGMCMRGTGVSTLPLKNNKQVWHLWFESAEPPPQALNTAKKAETDKSLSEKYGTFFSNGGYEAEDTEAFMDKHKDVWHPVAGTYGQLFDCSEKIIRIPLYDKIWDRMSNCSWTAAEAKSSKLALKDLGTPMDLGNIVLIGDAAKMILPSSGQGAGTAIEDATVLANCLLNCPPLYPNAGIESNTDEMPYTDEPEALHGPSFDAALKSYTKDRLPRYKEIARWSNFGFTFSLGRWWWERILRDYLPAWMPEPASNANGKSKEEEKVIIRKWQEGGGGKGRWDEIGMQRLLGARYEVKLDRTNDEAHRR